MNIIKSIYQKWRLRKLQDAAQQEALGNMFNSPKKYSQLKKEIDCLIYGHKWKSDFNPTSELNKPTRKRVYCEHCGVYYHENQYHNI